MFSLKNQKTPKICGIFRQNRGHNNPEETMRQQTKAAVKKEETDMAELSVLDLQNLRHLIGGYSTCHCKLQDYASQAQDPEVKKLFQDAANSAMKNKQDLMKFL